MSESHQHNYSLTHLEELESEAIFVIREAAASFKRPVMLFSGGKDSVVMAQLARRAFGSATVPFPLLHVDTGHNFPETMEFRDRFVNELGFDLVARTVQDSIDRGRVQEETGPNASRNALQTVTLLDALAELETDCAFGGGRRDEEKARAKERFFSHRDASGAWNPSNQRPELWHLYNTHHQPGEHFRAFPISNWTEVDIWSYIKWKNIEVLPLYYSHQRECVIRDGVILANSEYLNLQDGEEVVTKQVRFRTIGDMTCTGAVESDAADVDAILEELLQSRMTERGTRSDDKRSESAMEDRKKAGYF